ncbi:MAG: hypothetical protein GQ574_24260 [Crocinitomix sp.]|nr:hypothetical protein [Crocinitomix sp.]
MKKSFLAIAANNFLDGFGNIIEGNVEISLIEITTKSEMVMANKPTVTADGDALISGGEYFIDVTLPGSDVTLQQVDLMELDVPAGTDPANTSVFISVDYAATILTVEPMYFDRWSIYQCPQVPEGLAVHIGVIQMDPFTGDNTYDIQSHTIPFGGGAVNFSTLFAGSIGGLDADISALP